MPFEDRPKEEEHPRDFFRGRDYVEGQDRLVNGETDLLQIVETKKTGQGLVAKMPIKRGKRIFGIQGREETTGQDCEKKLLKSVNQKLTDYGISRITLIGIYPTRFALAK